MFSRVVSALLDDKDQYGKHKYVKLEKSIYRIDSEAHKTYVKQQKKYKEIIARGGKVW